MPEVRKPRVALLAAPEASSQVLYGLYDVLFSVGAVYPDMVVAEPGKSLLDVVIVAADRAPFRCPGNIPVEPHASVADAGDIDVAIVCDLYTPIDTPIHGRYTAEIAWLRGVHEGGALVASVCSGSLLLAEAGLLDGRQCAGHWAYRELFREHYPAVDFAPSAILCLAHQKERVVTAGGSSAWQDLALYVILQLCGAEHAIRTAKVYLFSGHEDGQLPFASMTRRTQNGDAVINVCQAWIAENYHQHNPVMRMAERSGLTPRTFARRFRAATGYLPIDYVHALRIEEAKEMIEMRSTALEDVGRKVGYEDPGYFRRLFKRSTNLTPAAYRRKFAAIGRPSEVS